MIEQIAPLVQDVSTNGVCEQRDGRFVEREAVKELRAALEQQRETLKQYL